MKRVKFLYLLTGMVLIIIALYLSIQTPLEEGTTLIFVTDGENVNIWVEVADSPEERSFGLMNRTFLGENNGMLFVFEGEHIVSFWMRNTLIPLDMVFISKDKQIVNVQENAQPCETNPCPTFSSRFPAKYVVEVNGGFTQEKGIKTGDAVKFEL